MLGARLVALVYGKLRSLQLPLDVSERLLPCLLVRLLLLLSGLLYRPSFPTVAFQSLNLSVHVIHIREQREVFSLQLDKNLHNLLNVLNACGLLYCSKRLLEHFDVFLVLLDVSTLDAIEESSLHDPSHHRALGEAAFLFWHDELLLLLHASLCSLELHLQLLSLPIMKPKLLTQTENLMLELFSLEVPMPPHHANTLLRVILHCLTSTGLLQKVLQLSGTQPDFLLQPIKDAIQLQPSPTEGIHLLA
mmetsp:Transcript_66661/g.123185  ORF Transcript_66661/g.123185 Transcript_66661/m.123185 type:complete len:248 (-) Transcript_66661:566-1309(-)